MVVDVAYIGAEWRLPAVRHALQLSFIAPILLYFLIFQTLSYFIKSLTWTSHHYSSHLRFRLRNLSVSLIHSMLSGGCALAFMLFNADIMFNDTVHWYSQSAAQLPLLSMGYFVHDAIDIINNEGSKRAFAILLHHLIIILAFAIGMLSRKFLPYAYWALLVEVSSVFIHIRTILEISKLYTKYPILYRTARIFSIATTIVFRLGVILWMLQYVISNRNHFHKFYLYAGIFADVFFFGFSLVLLFQMIYQGTLLYDAKIAENKF